MNFRTILTTMIVLVAALAGTVWLGRTNTEIEPAQSPKPKSKTAENRPQISETGPYPKVTVDESLYKFGEMAVGQSLSHKFILTNEGEAPLEVQKGDTSCKCTLSEMKDNIVPPGESIEVELTWTPKTPQEVFGQNATIWTNDPKNQELKLQVEGTVNKLISFTGEYQGGPNWSLPTMSSTTPVSFTGKIHTKYLDNFKILKLESSKPALITSVKPLTPDELKELSAKSGYSIKVTANPKDFPLGGFTENLTVKTDIPGDAKAPHAHDDHDHKHHAHDGHKHEEQAKFKDFVIQLSGNHTGPIRILPAFGVHWDPKSMTLNLGDFAAKDGKEVTISMFVDGAEKPLRIIDQEIKPDFLKFEINKDEKFQSKTKQRYQLTFKIPAGISTRSFGRKNPARVKLQTDHPDAKEIDFKLRFTAL